MMRFFSISRTTNLLRLSVFSAASLAAMFALTAADPLTAPADNGVVTITENPDERFRGLVQPAKQVVLNAPLDGILQELLVDEGKVVAANDTMAVMDYGVQEVTVEVAKIRADAVAALKRGELQVTEADILLEAVTTAFKKGAASEWEVRQKKLQKDQALAALAQAKEEVDLAKKTLVLEQEKLKRYKLQAPFNAKVIAVFVESGATMSRSDKLVSLAAMDELEANLYLPLELYRELSGKLGQDFELVAEEPVNKTLTGKLKYVQPIIDSASRTFRCIFTIENKDMVMPAGFTVKFTAGDKMLREANKVRAQAK